MVPEERDAPARIRRGNRYVRDQSLRFRIVESACLGQKSALCVPNFILHAAKSGQFFISQNMG